MNTASHLNNPIPSLSCLPWSFHLHVRMEIKKQPYLPICISIAFGYIPPLPSQLHPSPHNHTHTHFPSLPRYEYHWADGTTVKKPIKCSAPKYIEYLMQWVQEQLDDETIFPSKIGGQSSYIGRKGVLPYYTYVVWLCVTCCCADLLHLKCLFSVVWHEGVCQRHGMLHVRVCRGSG